MIDSSQKIENFFKKFTIRHYQKGNLIGFPDQNESTQISYLAEGRVIEYAINDAGERSILNTFKPGAFFPLSLVLTPGKCAYFFEATQATKIYQAPPARVNQFLQENPEVALSVLKRVYIGVDGLQQKLAQLMSGNARDRILCELDILARRFGVPRDQNIEVKITTIELAELTGLTRETISRVLKELKDDRLVEMERGRIILPAK